VSEPFAVRKHLFLTGERGVGKSTLLHRLIDMKGLDCTGFETRHVEIDGLRRAHMLHGLIDLPEFENDCICCVRVSEKRSVPVLPVFEENGVSILQRSLASPAPFILMDELGRLERNAHGFIAQVGACLDSEKCVLGVLQKCSASHIQQIMARDDVTVITVTEENRYALLEQLIARF